jgi:acetoin utilization deacetylase AcuC-like enzyme
MLVVEHAAYMAHDPRWVYTLGTETYRTHDVPSRVEVIRDRLEKDARFRFRQARRFSQARLRKLHPYHDWIKRTARGIDDPAIEIYPDLFPGEGADLPRRSDRPLWGGLWCTDAVTPLKRRTYDVAKGSAETALTAARLVATGREPEVYALCRPSGHHAGPRLFGGYCYFNNAVLAADLLAEQGAVAILDIDFHHGNGTQEFCYENPRIFTTSLHADPAVEYPYFWGYAHERGAGKGKGANRNYPLPLGATNEDYLATLDKAIRAVRRFKPAFLVISAGFDTHKDDPIGGLGMTVRVYPEIGRRLGAVGLPTVICQEGGYRGSTLGRCVHAFLSGFLRGREDA